MLCGKFADRHHKACAGSFLYLLETSLASDENVLLSAFYEESLLVPLRKPPPVYEFRTSPLHELIRHIGSRAGLSHAHIRFAGTDIRLSA